MSKRNEMSKAFSYVNEGSQDTSKHYLINDTQMRKAKKGCVVGLPAMACKCPICMFPPWLFNTTLARL